MLEVIPTENEKRLGALVHLAAIPAPWVAPIVGLVIGWQKPFLRYQAIKALIEQLLAGLLTASLIAISLTISIIQLAQKGFDFRQIDWVQLLIKSLVVWLLLLAFQAWNFVNAIRDAHWAFKGTLPNRPKWTERLAAKWTGLRN